MGSINFAAPFQLLRPIDVDPAKYAGEYAQLAALAGQAQYRQAEMARIQQETQLGGIQLAQARQGLQDQQTMQTLIPQMRNDPHYQTADGTLDWEGKVLPALQGKISQPTYDALEKNILANHRTHVDILKDQADIDTKNQELAQKQQDLRVRVNDALANGAADWREHGSNPAVAEGLLHQWEDLYPTAKPQLDNYRQIVAADPTKAAAIMGNLESYMSPAGQTARAGLAETTSKAAQAQAAADKDIAETRIKNFQADAIDAMKANPQASLQTIDNMLPNNPAANVYKLQFTDAMKRGDFDSAKNVINEAGKYATGLLKEMDPNVLHAKVQQDVAVAQATQPLKVQLAREEGAARAEAVFAAGGLTPDDIARAGEQYARTGIMPPMGRDSVTRARIVQAGNAWAKDQGMSPGDVVTMQAAYAGDKASLKSFQKQRDQIVSFEQTAQKNLNQFLDLAGKIPDTGVPWLNTPIRALDAKLVGSENMAAVNAARQVANNEIAKVTSGGGMSGVLSDAARQEVSSYSPQNATFAQTKAVARILQQDMQNRHQSMDATLSDIKSRIGGGGVSTAQPTQAPGAAGGASVKLKSGRTATFPDQKTADAFRKANPNLVQ